MTRHQFQHSVQNSFRKWRVRFCFPARPRRKLHQNRDQVQSRGNETGQMWSGDLAHQCRILVGEVKNARQRDNTHFSRGDGVGFLVDPTVSQMFKTSAAKNEAIHTANIPIKLRTMGSYPLKISHWPASTVALTRTTAVHRLSTLRS